MNDDKKNRSIMFYDNYFIIFDIHLNYHWPKGKTLNEDQ